MADAVTRSRVADGRVVGWYGAPGVVLDAEIADQPVPASLSSRFGAERFWERWTAAETAAKAADVPIVLWLRRHGLGTAGVSVRTLWVEDLVVSLAEVSPARRG